jgi:hypothetical protein
VSHLCVDEWQVCEKKTNLSKVRKRLFLDVYLFPSWPKNRILKIDGFSAPVEQRGNLERIGFLISEILF